MTNASNSLQQLLDDRLHQMWHNQSPLKDVKLVYRGQWIVVDGPLQKLHTVFPLTLLKRSDYYMLQKEIDTSSVLTGAEGKVCRAPFPSACLSPFLRQGRTHREPCRSGALRAA